MVARLVSPRRRAIRTPSAESTTSSKGLSRAMASPTHANTPEHTESKPSFFLYGKPIESFTKEELIDVIRDLARGIEYERDQHMKDLDFILGLS